MIRLALGAVIDALVCDVCGKPVHTSHIQKSDVSDGYTLTVLCHAEQASFEVPTEELRNAQPSDVWSVFHSNERIEVSKLGTKVNPKPKSMNLSASMGFKLTF